MDRSFDEILDDALHLPADKRVIVAERLYASVSETPEHRAAWQEDIEDRLTEYRRGNLKTHSAAEVRERINALLRR